MATAMFDSLTRERGSTRTRRSALRGFFAGAVAVVAGGAILIEETEGKRRKKARKGKRRRGQSGQGTALQPGERCQVTAQCTSGYICEVPVNGSNSDTYCSGGQGAICGAPNGDGDDTFPFCAVGFRCESSGGVYRCNAVPDDI